MTRDVYDTGTLPSYQSPPVQVLAPPPPASKPIVNLPSTTWGPSAAAAVEEINPASAISPLPPPLPRPNLFCHWPTQVLRCWHQRDRRLRHQIQAWRRLRQH